MRWIIVLLALSACTPLSKATLGVYTHVERATGGFHRRAIGTASGSIPFLDAGAGDVVLLLHGYQDSKDSWIPFARHLTNRYRVIIPDMHGFGENHADAHGDYRPPAQADRMHQLLLALGIRSANIVGVSMGGEVAAAFAAQYPDATETLGLFNTAGSRPDTLTPLGRRLLAGDNVFHVSDVASLDTLIRLIADSGFSVPGIAKPALVAEYRDRNATWDSVFAQLREPTMQRLTDSVAPLIRAPTLIVWGWFDPIFHRSTAQHLASMMQHAQVTMLENCGHLCAATRAEDVAARYLNFLRWR